MHARGAKSTKMRHGVSKEWNFYHSSEIFRSVEEICQLTLQTKNKFGAKQTFIES